MKTARIMLATIAVAITVVLVAFNTKSDKMIGITAASINGAEVANPNATTWTLDRSHSSISFSIEHLMVSEVEGKFRKFEGTMTGEKEDYSDAVVDFKADVSSIDTDDDKRDGHLKSDDFFNADKFPNIKFKSTKFKKLAGNKYLLTGDLTIRDITKSVSWSVVSKPTVKDPWGNIKAGFTASLTVNRFDYNLKWNTLTEAGGAVVGKDVNIKVNVEFAKK
ncbi:MAG: YceI family protein [Sphingobacteriales bacterium JAD_PAG50586_3]|nr:MAG: YceI family protein [Sphingobacteriales bacterium JAD_PAG50586_3]